MKREEKRDYLRDKIRSCIIGLTAGNGKTGKQYQRYNWSVGQGSQAMLVRGVCREAFMQCYEIRHTQLEVLCNDIRMGINASEKPLGDKANVNIKHHPEAGTMIKEIIRKTHRQGVNLSREQLSRMQLPNTVDSLAMYGWMDFYFDLVGDDQPNEDEIHLDPVPIKTVYEEYVSDAVDSSAGSGLGLKPLSKDSFCKMWKQCFPYVKVRCYKNVDGKCKTCSRLSYLRRKYRTRQHRQLITKLFYLHRTAYMGERCGYAQRCQLAIQSPEEYLSIATDGMQQAHCMLPYFGNLNGLGIQLPQHFQGVLVHGRVFNMFRSFHTIKVGSDFQIHTLLLTLEIIFKDKGKLPDTLYLQIDGGSENTAKVVLAMCELLVIMRLVQHLQVSRLMVGHTHIDVDGFFGRLWKFCRTLHLHTIGDYFVAIVTALSTAIMACMIYDIYVVPDYTKLFEKCVDPALGYYSKGDNTQLIFEFSACERSDWFPNGCKVRHRKFCQPVTTMLRQVKHVRNKDDEKQDILVDFEELESDDESDEEDTNIRVANVKSVWRPVAEYDENGNITKPEGMYILQELPKATSIQPKGLLKDSRRYFEKVMNRIRDYFQSHQQVIDDWIRWDNEKLPQSDDVQEYLQKCPEEFHIPFQEELFGGILPDLKTHVAPETRKKRNKLGDSLVAEEVMAGDISWGNRTGRTTTVKPEPYISREGDLSKELDASTLTLPKRAPKKVQNKQLKRTRKRTANRKRKSKTMLDSESSNESTFSASDPEYLREDQNKAAVLQGKVVDQDPRNAFVQKRNHIQESHKQGVSIQRYKRTNIRMTNLTIEESNRFEEICNGPAQMDELVVASIGGLEMTQKSFKRIKNSHIMLNDDVIDFCSQLMQKREISEKKEQRNVFLSVHFYNKLIRKIGEAMRQPGQSSDGGYCYSEVQRWTKHVDIFSSKKIYIPINYEKQHFVLIVIDCWDKTISCYDSLDSESCKLMNYVFD